MRAVTAPGRPVDRWAWGVSGLVAAAALAIPGTYLITMAGVPGQFARPAAVTVRTVTVTQPVTSLTVGDFGGRVRVTACRSAASRSPSGSATTRGVTRPRWPSQQQAAT